MAQPAIYHDVKEETTAEVSWIFQDPDAVAVASAAISTVTLTLYNESDDAIINSRNDQDILGGGVGANNVSITAGGSALWVMQPEDNVMMSSGELETHVALIEWNWDPGDGNGERSGKEEIRFLVENLTYVP